jgi:hypothetical protein
MLANVNCLVRRMLKIFKSKPPQKLSMNINQPDEPPVWAKQLNQKIDDLNNEFKLLNIVINTYHEDSERHASSRFRSLSKAISTLSADTSVALGGIKAQSQSIQAEVSALRDFTRKEMEYVLSALQRISEVETYIKNDTSDLEARTADIRARLQNLESECALILDILQKK